MPVSVGDEPLSFSAKWHPLLRLNCAVEHFHFKRLRKKLHRLTSVPPVNAERRIFASTFFTVPLNAMMLLGAYGSNVVSFLVFVYAMNVINAIPIDNSLVDAEMIKECITNKSVDLVLILDGSGSIGDETFQLQLNFVIDLARRLNVSQQASHIAIIQYAETPQLEMSLNQYTQPNQVEWAVQRIKYLSGATNTGAALKFALDNGFQGARGGGIPKVVVVVTDGQSQDAVSEPAQQLRDAHIMVYAIGVTNLVNVHQLHQIAGNPQRVLTVETFDQLDTSLADSLTWDMCKTEFRPGTPDIICGPDRIGVRASTKKPFDGYVFVMDHFHREECRAGPEMFPDPRSIGITVAFADCNVHRYRSLSPRGIFVEMTVVFMFHTTFMTKVDQMVKVQCFYMEADKTVSVPLEVSMLTTQFREKMYEMPRCEYTLRRGSPEGPIVEFASLGESVYHRWECIDASDTFGMLVHSCYVDNGYGDRVDILDQNGCGLDAVLLSTPDYDSSLRLATKPYHVFKYADRPVLQFQCQVTLCLKYDGGCEALTPPKCPETLPAHLHAHEHEHERARRRINPRYDHMAMETLDVFTTPLNVFDTPLPECSSPSESSPPHMLFYVLFTSFNLIIAVITGIFYVICMRKINRSSPMVVK